MNIFEQYGIKEVADCTLYAIALNKYNEEIYIPVMYFDTLKISTLDQTSSQVSARGGIGNPELIVWDYGKEISVSLQDALYTPAKQSLMWGGKFGIGRTKIYGAWDPYIYEKDKYGKPIYLIREVAIASMYDENGRPEEGAIWTCNGVVLEETPSIEDGWCDFVCPCDNQIKYMRMIPAEGHYKYASWLKDNPMQGYSLDEEGRFSGYTYEYLDEKQEIPSTYYNEDYFKGLMYQGGIKTTFTRPECGKIIMDTFLDFENATMVEDNGVLVETELCPKAPGRKAKDCLNLCGAFTDYSWLDTDISMISCEADQDLYYTEDIDIRFRIREEDSYRMAMVRTRGGEYDGKITIYKNLVWGFEDMSGKSFSYSTPIPVGTFYIIQDHNQETYAQQGYIFPLTHGIEDIEVLDRMEKCIAPQTFCINTDRNTTMFEYSSLTQYSQVPLTVFFDPVTMRPYEPNSSCFKRENGDIISGNLRIVQQYDTYYKWTRSVAPTGRSLGGKIIVDATHFPGTFRLVGETFSRRRSDFQDERYQFEIPLCKLSSDTSLELQADGGPSTYDFKFKVLRKEDGTMMKLTQYKVEPTAPCVGSTQVVPQDRINYEPVCKPKVKIKINEMFRLHPLMTQGTIYCVDYDCMPPFNQAEAYLRLPTSIEEADAYVYGTDAYRDEHRDLLLIEVSTDGGNSWSYVLESDITSGLYSFTIDINAGGVN